MNQFEEEGRRGEGTVATLPEGSLERLINYEAYDRNNEHIGSVSALWADDTRQPVFLGIKTFWLFGKTHVVPAHGAEVNQQRGFIRVPYTQEDVKDAPSYDPDADLDDAKREEVYSYYRTKGSYIPERTGRRGEAAAAARKQDQRQEATMSLSEEEVRVGKRQVEQGGVRLRKIIRTETVQQPVELQREDVVIERTPGRGQQPEGKAFEGEEIYIPLRREEPVVQKEARVREEVHARKTAATERQTISEQKRKEDVEVRRGEDTNRRK